MFRKIVRIIAVLLCVILIIDGLYQVLARGTNDWGLISVGAFFLIAVGPDAYDGFKKK